MVEQWGARGRPLDPSTPDPLVALLHLSLASPLFLLLAIPLNHADWKTLAVGATSLRQTVDELTELSLGTSLKVLGRDCPRFAGAPWHLAGVVAAVTTLAAP